MLKENNVYFNNIIIVQDSTIQKRMDAGFKKCISEDASTMNFISYDVNVVNENGHLKYYKDILGIWDINRYMTLLTGDISRLIDDENVYESKGKNN